MNAHGGKKIKLQKWSCKKNQMKINSEVRTGFWVRRRTAADPWLIFLSNNSNSSVALLTDSPHGWQAGVSIWCQLQIVQRWRAAGMQGCAISSPHSSQFTHQTFPSTLWSLRKRRLLHKNPLTGRYACGESEWTSQRAERAATRVMSKVWMTMSKRNPEHLKPWSTFSIIPTIGGVTLTIIISGQTQLTFIDYDSNMKLRRENIQQVWGLVVFFFINNSTHPFSTHSRVSGASTSFLQGQGGVHPGQVTVEKHQQAFTLTPRVTLESPAPKGTSLWQEITWAQGEEPLSQSLPVPLFHNYLARLVSTRYFRSFYHYRYQG